MLIRNVSIDNELAPQTIFIDDSATVHRNSMQRMPGNITVIDANNSYVLLPGLLDTHIHGIAGYDFTDGTYHSVYHRCCARYS